MRLSEEVFAELVRLAMERIPASFEPYLADISVDVEPMPDRATCVSLGIRDPRDLLGLYRGTPLTERSVEHISRMPDRITIYHHNIERMCRSRAQVIDQVRKTVLHEIGHHFGLDEDDLDELGYQ